MAVIRADGLVPHVRTAPSFKLDQTNLLLSRVPCQRLGRPSDPLSFSHPLLPSSSSLRTGRFEKHSKHSDRTATTSSQGGRVVRAAERVLYRPGRKDRSLRRKTRSQTQIKRLLGPRGYPSSWQRIRRGGRSRAYPPDGEKRGDGREKG